MKGKNELNISIHDWINIHIVTWTSTPIFDIGAHIFHFKEKTQYLEHTSDCKLVREPQLVELELITDSI